MDLVVPDPRKSLRDGAIAPWNTPAYTHELEELIALADDYDIPLDVPFTNLTEPATATDPRRRAGAQVRRTARVLRLAGATKIQDAPARVSQPLAELSALPGLRRHAVAARGAGDASRRPQHRRSLRTENSRRRSIFSAICRCPTGNATVGRIDAGAGASRGSVSWRRSGLRLSHARSHAAHAQRRRSAARFAHQCPGLEPGQHALRARRAVGRPASGRHRSIGRSVSIGCATAAIRCSWSSTKNR